MQMTEEPEIVWQEDRLTPELRWNEGVLEQKWNRVVCRRGTGIEVIPEWRRVPSVPAVHSGKVIGP